MSNHKKDDSTLPSGPPSLQHRASIVQLKDIRTNDHSIDGLISLGGKPSAIEQQRIQQSIEDQMLSNLEATHSSYEKKQTAFQVTDLLPYISSGVECLVSDDFSKCFESARSQPWNWNVYLFPLWCMGVLIRYCVLFPIRFISLLTGALIYVMWIASVKKIYKNDEQKRLDHERAAIRFLCGSFVFSWTGVIKYHGTIPSKKVNRVYVANHTSMIDMIVLSQVNTFSLVGQKHPGWVGFMQDYVLGCLGNAWFNRGEASDRLAVARKIKNHINNPESNRLLVFPEGTCVNNEYCVQFKQGVFDMGAEVCPIAIKYNKIFVDAFWNSRAQSFAMHLITLMTSWAVVCDVWYLEPQTIQPGEDAITFSNRVKKMIAQRAGLKDVSWDGYLKHFKATPRYIQQQQKIFAQKLLQKIPQSEIDEIERQDAADSKQLARDKEAESAQTEKIKAVISKSNADLAVSTATETPKENVAAPTDPIEQDSNTEGGSSLSSVNSAANLIDLLNEKEEEEKNGAKKRPNKSKRDD